MAMVLMEMAIFIFVVRGRRLQWVRPSWVLFFLNRYQDLGLRDKERGVVIRSTDGFLGLGSNDKMSWAC